MSAHVTHPSMLRSWIVLARLRTLMVAGASLLRDGHAIVGAEVGLGEHGCARPTIYLAPDEQLRAKARAGHAWDYKRRVHGHVTEVWWQFARAGARVIWIERAH